MIWHVELLASEAPPSAGIRWLGLRSPPRATPPLADRRTGPLSAPAVEAIASRAVHKVRGHRDLGRYAPIAETPGFIRAIAGVVTEMRLARLAPDGLVGIAV